MTTISGCFRITCSLRLRVSLKLFVSFALIIQMRTSGNTSLGFKNSVRRMETFTQGIPKLRTDRENPDLKRSRERFTLGYLPCVQRTFDHNFVREACTWSGYFLDQDMNAVPRPKPQPQSKSPLLVAAPEGSHPVLPSQSGWEASDWQGSSWNRCSSSWSDDRGWHSEELQAAPCVICKHRSVYNSCVWMECLGCRFVCCNNGHCGWEQKAPPGYVGQLPCV